MVYDVQTGGRLAVTLYHCGVSSASLVSSYPAEKLGQGEGPPGTSAPWEASWFRIRGAFLPLSCSGWLQHSRCPLDRMEGAKETQARAGELLVSRESFQAYLARAWHWEQGHAYQGWRQAVVGSSTRDGLAPLTWPQLSPFQEPPSLTGNNCVATQGSQTEA